MRLKTIIYDNMMLIHIKKVLMKSMQGKIIHREH